MAANPPHSREQLVRAGRLPEAYQAFKAAVEAEPLNPNWLFNAGMGAYLLHDWAEAAVYWARVKDLQPDDIALRARLVQVYELLDGRAEREAERAGLYALHQRLRGSPKDLPCYPRDQFQILGWRVLVLEYFELAGPLAMRYQFLVQRGPALEPEFILALGASDLTNAAAPQPGQLPPGERLFHLDEHRPGEQTVLAIFQDEPAYDELKVSVCEYIAR